MTENGGPYCDIREQLHSNSASNSASNAEGGEVLGVRFGQARLAPIPPLLLELAWPDSERVRPFLASLGIGWCVYGVCVRVDRCLWQLNDTHALGYSGWTMSVVEGEGGGERVGRRTKCIGKQC